MMNRTLPILALACAPLVAQVQTSPKGFLTVEGDDVCTVFAQRNSMSTLQSYYCHVDQTQSTEPARQITRLSLRRDGTTPAVTTAGIRQTTVAIRLAHADWGSIVSNVSHEDWRWRLGSWSNSFAAKTVNLPNLNNQPASGTAPFAVQFPLDTPFSHNGTHALALQIRWSPNNLANDNQTYPIDFHTTDGYAQGDVLQTGTACTASGSPSPLGHSSYLFNYGDIGSNAYWQLVTSYAPANAPIVTVIGLQNPNLAIGCGRLHATPDIVLPVVTASGSGFYNHALNLPHRPAYIGAQFWSQSFAYDAAQPGVPFAMSKGLRTTYPTNPVIQQQVAYGFVWTSSTSWPTHFTLRKGTAIVFGLHS